MEMTGLEYLREEGGRRSETSGGRRICRRSETNDGHRRSEVNGDAGGRRNDRSDHSDRTGRNGHRTTEG